MQAFLFCGFTAADDRCVFRELVSDESLSFLVHILHGVSRCCHTFLYIRHLPASIYCRRSITYRNKRTDLSQLPSNVNGQKPGHPWPCCRLQTEQQQQHRPIGSLDVVEQRVQEGAFLPPPYHPVICRLPL